MIEKLIYNNHTTNFKFSYKIICIYLFNQSIMRKPRQQKENRTDVDISHSIRNTVFTITTLPPQTNTNNWF